MLSPIQIKLLEMLKWFDAFCSTNHLQYYAIGGTLLGAARHKGFIPWDDDVDVALPRPDYNRLLSLSNTLLGRYVLETPYSANSDYLFSFSKLYDTTTTLIERTRVSCKRGIYIDIFPLDGIGNSEKESKKNFKKFDRINMLLMTRTCALSKRRSFFKNLSIIFGRSIPGFFIDNKKLAMKVDKKASACDFDTSKYVGNLMGAYREKEIFERDYIGKMTRYVFEDITICGFEFFDAYLKGIYGDWRKLPPADKRGGSHDYVAYNLNQSYLLN